MQAGDRVFSVSAYIDRDGQPRHYMSKVTIVDECGGDRPLVELGDGTRLRILRSQCLAATEAEAKLLAADRLDALARPFHEQAAKLRQEALAMAAAEQVVTA